MEMIKLIVEKTDGLLWGRIDYNDNLIVESGNDINELKQKMSALLLDFEGVEVTDFEIAYDLTTFFEVFDFLKISKLANVAGVNESLLRHYAASSKTASTKQIEKIERAINSIGKELTALKLV